MKTKTETRNNKICWFFKIIFLKFLLNLVKINANGAGEREKKEREIQKVEEKNKRKRKK